MHKTAAKTLRKEACYVLVMIAVVAVLVVEENKMNRICFFLPRRYQSLSRGLKLPSAQAMAKLKANNSCCAAHFRFTGV